MIQVRVRSDVREVDQWDQPLVTTKNKALVALLCQRQEGVLHFLVQASMEPGNFDSVELTSTVDCIPGDYDEADLHRCEPFYSAVMVPPEQTVLRVTQSEEGGRFFRDETDYRLVLVDDSERLELPPEFCWMTLGQMGDLVRFSNVFTNQMRSLMAVLRLLALC